MCILVVCTFDHIDQSGQLQPYNFKRGDIVEVFNDGADPGVGIVNCSGFRLVNNPGIPASKYITLSSQDMAEITNPANALTPAVKVFVRHRYFSFNLTAAETAALAASSASATWPATSQGWPPISIADASMSTLVSAKTPYPAAQILTMTKQPSTYTVTPVAVANPVSAVA